MHSIIGSSISWGLKVIRYSLLLTGKTLVVHGLTKCEQKAITHAKDEGVPSFVLQVGHRVDSVANQQGKQRPPKILEGQLQKKYNHKSQVMGLASLLIKALTSTCHP